MFISAINFNSFTFTDPLLRGLVKALPDLPALIFDVILAIAIGGLAIRVITLGLRGILKLTNIQSGLRGVIASVAEIILWISTSIGILQLLHFTGVIVFFTGSVAAIGLAMAVGGSTLISDIVAGISLAQDVDFNVGDEVIAGETPTRGVIESMDARRTRLRGEDGILHVIPNTIIERKEWILMKKRHEASPLAKAAVAAQKLRTAALKKHANAKERQNNRDIAQ